MKGEIYKYQGIQQFCDKTLFYTNCYENIQQLKPLTTWNIWL